MIIVSGTIAIDPANSARAAELIAALVPATLAEDGNITYGYWAHLSEPGVFRVYEEWQDQAALDTHFGTPHMAAFMGAFGDLGVKSLEINKNEVSETSKLM